MGDEARFSVKWDFRRKENDFEDSSSDDPDSNSTQDPIIHNPNVLLHSNQIGNGPKTVTREEPVKTRKRRSRKDESKAKEVRRRKPKTVCAEENRKKEGMETEMDGVGMFMETLLDDLTASRERLMDWMNTELHGASDENVASRPPPKKRGVAAVAAQRSVKKRMTKKKKEEEEKMKKKEEEEKERKKQSKLGESSQEMNRPEEQSSEIAHNGGDLDRNAGPLDRGMNTPKEKSPKVTQNGGDFDCNGGPLNRFPKSCQGGLGRNYTHQLQEDQEALVTQTEMENPKNETVKSQKSIVLAIEAPTLSKKQKKTSKANTSKNKSAMVERTGPETQKDHNFVTPFALLQRFPKLSSSPLLQSFPVPSSLFPLPSQGIIPSASKNNFQLRQPVAQSPLASNNNFQLRQPVAQTTDLSEFQTGGQGFDNSLFHNNGYFSGRQAAFQPNMLAGGYNFPPQLSSGTSSQNRDDNNMFGGLRMAGGAIRFSGNRFPEAEVGNCINDLYDYRTSSRR